MSKQNQKELVRDLTKICEAKGCNRKYILPFKCKRCGKNFCRIHRLPENHSCENL